jgi:AcrR family transcriptional regulator
VPTVSDDQILEAALGVIAQHGYVGATTREIASAAGINEVTLFRRYGSKKNLLMAAVEQEAKKFTISKIEYTGDLEADLLKVFDFYQRLMQNRGHIIMMLLNEIPRQPELLEIMQIPMLIISKITEMIERYQQEGVLAQGSPLQAFMALVGPLLLEGVIRHVQPGLEASSIDPQEHVQRYLRGRIREE